MLALLISCERQVVPPEEDGAVRMTVSCAEAASKVSLDPGLKTVWNRSDLLSVFYRGSANSKAVFTGEDKSPAGPISFKCPASGDSDKVSGTYAVIPYRKDNTLTGNIIHSSIPAVQHYKAGSFDPEAVLLTAFSENENLNFRYACSVLSLELKCEGTLPIVVESVALSAIGGESLAGDVAIDMQDPANPVTSPENHGSSTIELCSNTGAPLCTITKGKSEFFYFCVAPGELSKGYEFSIRCSDAPLSRTVVSRNTAASVLEAGKLSGITCMTSVQKTIVIDFNTVSFTPSLPSASTAPSAYSYSYSFDGGRYSIMPNPNGGKFYLTEVDGVKCLRFDAAKSCLRLPYITGMSLKVLGVRVLQGDSVSGKSLSLSSSDVMEGDRIPEDIVPLQRFPNKEMTRCYVDVAPNTPLYLFMEQINIQLSRIEMVFE